jgi:2-dehydro-3-deoxyphosphogalactonate aldolase
MLTLPLVAILRGVQPFEAQAHARALLGAGFECIEVPTNSPDWARSVHAIVSLTGSAALVGAGTVLDSHHLDQLQAAGGALAVSPHTDVALIRDAVGRGLLCLPGALTPSEVLAAWHAGAQAVKLFPASSMGPAHVRALRAVMPIGMPLLAVGGISASNLAEYVQAGCHGAGLGGELYRPGQKPEETATQAAAFVQAWRAATAGERA